LAPVKSKITKVGDVTLKRCSGCGHRKRTPDEFYERKRSWDGLTARCKDCMRITNHENYYYRRLLGEQLNPARTLKPTGDETWKRRITSDAVRSVLAGKLWDQTQDATKALILADEIIESLKSLVFSGS
jgi:hypothetical protein